MNVTAESGKYWGVPHHTDTVGSFYNKQYAQKAGIKIPANINEDWTFDEWTAVGKRMKEANNLRFAVSSHTRNVKTYGAVLYAMGGSIYNIDQTQGNFNSPEGIRAITWTTNLVKDNLQPMSVMWRRVESNSPMFANGDLALSIDGQWMMPYMEKNMKNYDWGVTYMPKDKIRASDFGGNGIMINGATKKADAAWTFTNYMIGKEGMEIFCRIAAFIPARKSAAASINYPKYNNELKIFSQISATVPVIFNKERKNPSTSAVERIYGEEIELAAQGKKTPTEAAEAIDKRINEVLKRR